VGRAWFDDSVARKRVTGREALSVHVPVLRDEVLRYLSPRSRGSLVVDGTVGEGGHADLFLRQDPTLELVGVDADPAMLDAARQRLASHGSRCRLVHARFSAFFARYAEHCARPANAVLLDLGVSMYHFRSSGRGFSFSADEPLDMRLDPAQETTAADLVNTLAVDDLADLIYEYGEERQSRRIARAVVAARGRARISGSRELADIVARCAGRSSRSSRIHPATRVFQALRIAVNDELAELERGLGSALGVLAPGGRIGVISFHSLEDRVAKRILRAAAAPAEGPASYGLVARKPLVAGEEEVRSNPASRSAKLRVAERLGGETGGCPGDVESEAHA
jgi:16S rRNA (cytosine1402-N4)-methyltransferase